LSVTPASTSVFVNSTLAPVAAYEATFEMLARRGVFATGRAMLVAHYEMPHHVTTMRHLASAVCGTPDHRIANWLYGSFAARVRRELDVARPKFEIGVLATWPEPPIDELGEFAFRLRPEVCAALCRLGWVSAPSAPRRPAVLHHDRSMIRKLKSGEYRLYSRKKNPKTGKRRNLGTFKTRAAAEKHEKAVQFFKRQG
jgi:hypothetical protein